MCALQASENIEVLKMNCARTIKHDKILTTYNSFYTNNMTRSKELKAEVKCK